MRISRLGIRGSLVLSLAIALAATTAPAAFADGSMALDCDAGASGIQDSCNYASGDTFSVQVNVTEPPKDGYFGLQAKLSWTRGKFEYRPTRKPRDEALWDDCDIPARSDDQKKKKPSLLFACVPLPPLESGDEDTGAVLKFKFKCEAGGTSPIKLVPRKGDPQEGTHFIDDAAGTVDATLKNASVNCGAGEKSPASTAPKKDTDKAAKKERDACAGLKGEELAECKARAECRKLKGEEREECLEKVAQQTESSTPTSATPEDEDSDDGLSPAVLALLIALGVAMVGGAAFAIRRRMGKGKSGS